MTMHPIFFIDTETGGLDPHTHSLLEVGLAVVARGEIVERHEWFVRLDHYVVDARAMKVTGLNLVEVFEGGVRPEQLAAELRALSVKYTTEQPRGTGVTSLRPRLGGQNAPFDRDFLDQHLPGGSRSVLHHENVDIKGLVSYLTDKGKLPAGSSSLGGTYERVLGRPLEGAHRALTDAVAAAEVYLELLRRDDL